MWPYNFQNRLLPCDQRQVSPWSCLLVVRGGTNGLITGVVELKEREASPNPHSLKGNVCVYMTEIDS